MEERFASIPGFPAYRVSDRGYVERVVVGRTGAQPGPLKPAVLPKGYHFVTLYAAGKKKQLYVHRLVADAFIENPDSLPEVNHKDGIKAWNHHSNLEWATRGGNNLHKARVLGLINGKRRYRVWRDGGESFVIENLNEFAQRNSLHQGACTLVAQGKRSHHHGWHFAYADKD